MAVGEASQEVFFRLLRKEPVISRPGVNVSMSELYDRVVSLEMQVKILVDNERNK